MAAPNTVHLNTQGNLASGQPFPTVSASEQDLVNEPERVFSEKERNERIVLNTLDATDSYVRWGIIEAQRGPSKRVRPNFYDPKEIYVLKAGINVALAMLQVKHQIDRAITPRPSEVRDLDLTIDYKEAVANTGITPQDQSEVEKSLAQVLINSLSDNGEEAQKRAFNIPMGGPDGGIKRYVPTVIPDVYFEFTTVLGELVPNDPQRAANVRLIGSNLLPPNPFERKD